MCVPQKVLLLGENYAHVKPRLKRNKIKFYFISAPFVRPNFILSQVKNISIQAMNGNIKIPETELVTHHVYCTTTFGY